MDRFAVAKRVVEARKARGMTQEDLAANADVSSTHISVLERGVKLPNLDTFIAIANALDTSRLMELPEETRKRIIRALNAFLED